MQKIIDARIMVVRSGGALTDMAIRSGSSNRDVRMTKWEGIAAVCTSNNRGTIACGTPSFRHSHLHTLTVSHIDTWQAPLLTAASVTVVLVVRVRDSMRRSGGLTLFIRRGATFGRIIVGTVAKQRRKLID